MRPNEMRLDTSVVATCAIWPDLFARPGTPTSVSKARGEIPDIIISTARPEWASSVSRIKSILPRCAHPKQIGNYPFRAAVDFTAVANHELLTCGGSRPTQSAFVVPGGGLMGGTFHTR